MSENMSTTCKIPIIKEKEKKKVDKLLCTFPVTTYASSWSKHLALPYCCTRYC